MKIALADLKKALNWIETNSKDVVIDVVDHHDGKLYLKCQDKYEVYVEITLYHESSMLPKIRKEDILK